MIIVRIVPNVSPAITVTAMPIQKTSCNNGITPSTVVAAASTTGLNRESAESTMA